MADIPHFENEDEEREYWATHSAVEYLDTLPEVQVSVKKPRRRKKQIGFRLYPEHIEALKAVAAQKGVPYQALIRMWLIERLREEAPTLLETETSRPTG